MWLYVAVGGMLGTLARFFLHSLIQPRASVFPLSTVIINILGSLALGFVVRYAAGTIAVSPALRAGLTVGVCGGFTTMSAFAFETVSLVHAGRWTAATAYLGLTVLGSTLAVVLGAAIADRLA